MIAKKLSRRRGSAVVELALSGTLMMLIAFGASDFAAIFFDAIVVANSAGSAAFYGANDNIRAGDFTAIKNQAKSDSEDDVGTVTPTVTQKCICPGGTAFPCSNYQETTCAGYGTPRAYVTVTVSEEFDSFSEIGLFPNITVNRSATMRVK